MDTSSLLLALPAFALLAAVMVAFALLVAAFALLFLVSASRVLALARTSTCALIFGTLLDFVIRIGRQDVHLLAVAHLMRFLEFDHFCGGRRGGRCCGGGCG